MVKLVDRGPHPSVIKEVVCKNCGATLSYTPNDIKERVTSDYTGSKDIDYYIKCPVEECKKDIYVKRY
jgi:hypothetical protein